MSALARKLVSVGIGVAALAVVVAALALVVSMGAAQASGSASAQVYNGDYSTVFVPPDAPGSENYLIMVQVDRLDKDSGAFLFYEIDRWDPGADPKSPDSIVTIAAGSGPIPNSAYTTDRAGRVYTLDFDTTAFPVYDPNNQSEPPGESYRIGPGGQISLVWEKTSFFRYTSNGSATAHYPFAIIHEGGKSAGYSASATGSVIGHAVASENAEVGSNQGVSVFIERAPAGG